MTGKKSASFPTSPNAGRSDTPIAPPSNPPAPLTLIKRKEVERMTTLSCAHIYVLVGKGDFPAPVKLGERSVAWVQAEVEQWIAQKASNRQVEGAQ